MHDVFDAMFVPEDEVREELGPDDIDEIPYSGGTIDLGEAAAEQLALALDPYPRIDGAAMPDFDGEDTGPFAALARRRTDGTK